MRKKIFYRGFLVAFSLLVGLTNPGFVSALSNQYLDMFSQNNILFYDPSGKDCATVGGTSSGDSDGSDVYVIGDSITVNSQNAIKDVMPDATINARSGSYFNLDSDEFGPSGVSRVASMGNQSVLVFALGTNGGVSESDVAALFSALSGKSVSVVLMTIFYSNHYSDSQMTNTNNVIKNAASQYSNVSIMDWAAAAGENENKYISSSDHVHPTDEGKQLFAKIMKEAVDQVSTVGSSSSTGDGKFDAIYSAKNADQYVFNVADYSEWSARWGDGDVATMSKLLNNYGDLAYQLGRAVGAPYVAILVQMRYEDPNSVCGANNFWGNGCDSSHAYAGGATIQSANLAEGFIAYGKTLTNGFHDQALGIEDPKEYLEKIGPTWVQGDINGPGYGSIEGMKKSVDALTEFIESAEGQAIVKQFGNYTGTFSGRRVCSTSQNYAGNGVTVANYNGTTVAFPIAYATKSNVSGGRGSYTFLSNLPCNHSVGCHYGEGAPAGQAAAAFDVCLNTSDKCNGATVVAMVSGTITREITTVRNGANCNHVRILSDFNNKTIAYMHLEYDADLSSRLPAGTHVNAGTVIGNVSANSPCHDNSTPHVHIDMNSVAGESGGPVGDDRDSEIVPLMNAAYNALPENDAELAAREAAGGNISENGLTYEQAKQFAIYYGENRNNSSYNATNALWDMCNGGGSNCVTFSAFFMNKFTNTNVGTTPGDGKNVVNNLAARGVLTGTEPRVWSVFSWDSGEYGHTGVVLGYENGEWIVGHASCSRSARGAGDGTKEGPGSAYILKSSNIVTAVLGVSNGLRFAYFDDQVDLGAIMRYLETGE